MDLSAVRRVKVAGRLDFEFRGEMLNAFNHPNFTPVISTSSNADNYRITGVQEKFQPDRPAGLARELVALV